MQLSFYNFGRKNMIRRATIEDAETLAILAIQMWDSHERQELAEEFAEMLTGIEAVCFIGYDGDDPIAFAQCSLRHDYVEGTDSSPVGYLEGIFVVEKYRKQGIARELLSACEAWAREMNCTEFASDCELTNEESLQFHMSVGFQEANRIICFRKSLG